MKAESEVCLREVPQMPQREAGRGPIKFRTDLNGAAEGLKHGQGWARVPVSPFGAHFPIRQTCSPPCLTGGGGLAGFLGSSKVRAASQGRSLLEMLRLQGAFRFSSSFNIRHKEDSCVS